MDTPTPEFKDIQGLLARGHKDLTESCFLMLRFSDRQAGKDWLGQIADRVSTANDEEEVFALQIAFTYPGITILLDEEKLKQNSFSREFRDGMTNPERRRILGDLDQNGPEHWEWGSDTQEEVHAVLMLYARDKEALRLQYLPIADGLRAHSIQEVITLDTNSECPDRKEHFGFADGLSQPKIRGFEKNAKGSVAAEPDFNLVHAGEFVLGYKNEYDKQPSSPLYDDGTPNGFDIGRNGSYMVFRQLEQRVREFWAFVYGVADKSIHFADKDPIYIASKMVGRFPNGNPLTLVADAAQPATQPNNFLYKAQDDADGLKCPIGSHIRKSNPRDSIDEDPKASITISKHHRILRRGRSYGAPLDPGMDPDKILASADTGKRGLYFICFNANIARQFEFIQQTWDNNPKLGGLDYDVDPLVGYTYMEGRYSPGTFTIPDCPVRRKVHGIPQFVYVKGGAYFFMPGIAALRFIGGLR